MSADTSAWRGVAAEKADEVSAGLAALLRERSRRLLGDLLRPYRRAVILTISLIVVESLAALAGPWLVGIAIDAGLPPLLHGGDVGPLLGIAGAFAVAVAVQAVTTRMFVTMTGRVGQKVVLELRRRLFAHFLSLEVAFHEDYTSGRVISRQVSDVEAISDLFEEGLDSLIAAVLTLLLVGTGMLLLDWQLGLVVLAGFIPLTWLTVWFRRESARAYRRTRETIALVIVHFVETFGGIRAVQAFRREKRNSEIFSGLGRDYADASTHASRLIAIYGPSISLVGNIITGVVLGYGGLLAIEGNLKVGVLATFLLYLQRFFDPLQDVSQFYNIFQSAASGLEKISGVLEQDAAVPEPTAPEPLPPRAALADPARRAPAPAPAGRQVRFESVTFGYRDNLVLPGLDLDIPAGQTVAMVGETGAGKTTIARLLGRFYDPRSGRVTLDGVDLRQLPDSVLRSEIIVITQENFLFEGSVADNIRLGRPDALRRGRGEGLPDDRSARLHRGAAGGLRHLGRQARRPAVGRAAPADLVRAGVPGRPGRARPGRGHVAARHPERAAGAGRAADRAGRPDRGDHRAPAVHGRDRRPGPGPGPRADHRGRAAQRADVRRRRVRRAARELGRQPGLRPAPGRGIRGDDDAWPAFRDHA